MTKALRKTLEGFSRLIDREVTGGHADPIAGGADLSLSDERQAVLVAR